MTEPVSPPPAAPPPPNPPAGPVHAWWAETVARLRPGGVRLAMPVAAVGGAWEFAGWSAARWVTGAEPDGTDPSVWPAIIEAGRAFHRMVAGVPHPAVLGRRSDLWAVADRVAWQEETIGFVPELAGIARRLREALGSLGPLNPMGTAQLVHGDLSGNVLFAPGLAPAVIDVSPYWRPPAYAEGIALADALCWYEPAWHRPAWHRPAWHRPAWHRPARPDPGRRDPDPGRRHQEPHDAWTDLLAITGVPVAAVAQGLLFRVATTNQRVLGGAGTVDLPTEAEQFAQAATALGL